MKRLFAILACVLLMLGTLSGCGRKPFACGDLQIDIPDDFIELTQPADGENRDFLFGRDTLIVKGMAEKKSGLKKMTLEEYTDLMITGNQLDCSATVAANGYRFVYRAAVGEGSYTYFSATFEGTENFWSVQCYCPSEDFAKYQQTMEALLNSVKTDLPFTG